jgi:hypothetical protein
MIFVYFPKYFQEVNMKYNNTPVVVELGAMQFPKGKLLEQEREDFLKRNPGQTFVKNFFFSTDDTKIIKHMENAVWLWLSDNNPEIVSQSMMVKDGKYHIVLTVFYKVKGEK